MRHIKVHMWEKVMTLSPLQQSQSALCAFPLYYLLIAKDFTTMSSKMRISETVYFHSFPLFGPLLPYSRFSLYFVWNACLLMLCRFNAV